MILTRNDYDIIMANLKNGVAGATFNRQNAEELEAELKKAKLVNSEDMPADVVRLNSRVTVKEENTDKLIHLTVVTPEKADIKQRKISILSPIGTALIGYRKGSSISWEVPAGRKTFTILDVE